MGFGFNLFFIFILVPLTGILVFTWLLTRKKIFGILLGLMWLGVFGLVILSGTVKTLSTKKELDKNDYYGQYIVNRDYFPGRQSDWQYNNFRFEIKENDSMYFHVTDKEKIVKTYHGTITTTKPYSSERLVLSMDQPTHHILTSNPTTYRSAWSFYLVFYSPKFNNVYFKKGQWTPLSQLSTD
jgi:hypothetical protein